MYRVDVNVGIKWKVENSSLTIKSHSYEYIWIYRLINLVIDLLFYLLLDSKSVINIYFVEEIHSVFQKYIWF